MTDLTTPAQIVTVTSSQGDVLWSGPASSDESAWRQACTAAGYDRPEDEPELCGTPADYTYEREPANISLAEYLSRPNVIVSLTLATGSEDDCSWIDGETEFAFDVFDVFGLVDSAGWFRWDGEGEHTSRNANTITGIQAWQDADEWVSQYRDWACDEFACCDCGYVFEDSPGREAKCWECHDAKETEFFVVAVESDDAQGTSGPFYFYFGDHQLVFDSKEAAEGTSSFLAACDIFGPDGDQYLQDVGARYVVHGPMSADQVRSEYESQCTQRCGSDVKI